MPDVLCPKHGPYDTKLGHCPYCQPKASRPLPPAPLSDDLPTEFFGSQRTSINSDDLPTEMPDRRGYLRRSGEEDQDDIDTTVIDRPRAGLLGWLIVKSGGRYGQIHKIKTGISIGRDIRKADLVLENEKVSGKHARISVSQGHFVLTDLESANGTYVNGQEILGPMKLMENDEIKIGDVVLVLKTLGGSNTDASDK
jgi:hypothetical protein